MHPSSFVTKKYPILRLAILMVVLASSTSPVAGQTASYPPAVQDSSLTRPAQDLLLFGFGEMTLHTWGVKGNIRAFESSNPSLKDDFSANYRASLFADGDLSENFYVNGLAVLDSRIDDEYRNVDPSLFRLRMSLESKEPLWDHWRFTGEGLYDPNRIWEFGNLDTRLLTQPQIPARLELKARLESDENGYFEGGSLQPSFKGAKFSLYQRSLFGVYADVYSGPVGVEAVGGKLEGKTFREGTAVGIRADGTTGPFDLVNAPVIRGSEVVKVEVRDRFNETTVLETRTMMRDIDYNVDYERGRIILYQPVSSETVASDPVYIVITYDYERTDNDELVGSRARVMPNEDITASASYLHRIIDDNAGGAGAEEPEDLFAGDVAVDLDRYGKGYLEVAGAQNDSLDNTNGAIRAGWEADVIEDFTVKADFQRIEDQFRSFGNTDLTPTANQRRLNLAGDYDFTERQNIQASFQNIRGLQANGEFNTYPGKRDEKVFALGYSNRLTDNFRVGAGLERRDVENVDNPDNEDTRQQRLVLDVNGQKDRLSFVKLFDYGVHYEYITFRNQVSGGTGNTNTNQFALRLGSTPGPGYRVQLTQKIRLLNDRDLDRWAEREDGTFANVRVQPHKNFSALATLELKRFTEPGDALSFWQDDPHRIERSFTLAGEYLPLEQVKALGKFGRYQVEQWWGDSTACQTNDFILGQFTYFASHHLSFDLDNEYTRRAYEANVNTREKIWDLGFRVNWNKDRLNDFTAGIIRRWQLSDYPPADELKSTSYIIVVGGSASLGYNLFARASIKDILLRDLLEDGQTHLILEAGYEDPSWFRVSLGYERIENDPDELFSTDYYRGHGLFARFVGKF